MDITRYTSVQLSKDDDRYQEKTTALNEAGFWYDPVEDRWIKPEPLEGSAAAYAAGQDWPDERTGPSNPPGRR